GDGPHGPRGRGWNAVVRAVAQSACHELDETSGRGDLRDARTKRSVSVPLQQHYLRVDRGSRVRRTWIAGSRGVARSTTVVVAHARWPVTGTVVDRRYEPAH